MSNQVLSKSNTYKTTRRRCYARNVGVITATLAILLGTAFFISSPFRAPEASPDVLPLDCTTNGLDIDITPSATLVQHGDIITYVVCFDNDNPGDCTVTAVESTLVLPDDTVITILSDATIAGPDDPVPGDAFCCPSADLCCATVGPYAYVVSHDDETGPVAGCPPEKNGGNTVKIVAAYAEFSGTVHISPVDLDGSAEGCKTAPAVVQHGACCFPDEETCAEDYGTAE